MSTNSSVQDETSPTYKLAAAVWKVTWFNLLCWPSFASWQATGCCYHLPWVVLLSRREPARSLPGLCVSPPRALTLTLIPRGLRIHGKATELMLPDSNSRRIRGVSQIPRRGKHKMVITNSFLHHIFLKPVCFIHVRVFSFALQPWGWNITPSFPQVSPEICSLFTCSLIAAVLDLKFTFPWQDLVLLAVAHGNNLSNTSYLMY